MRAIELWDRTDLEVLITDQVEEGLRLDYKEARAFEKTDEKRLDISKAVSAMANSAGGKIIYGMKEEGHLAVRIDPIDGTKFSREWLEEVINAKVDPRIHNLVIKPIRLTGGSVYVVEVPESDRAHQAGDQKYYRRFNFQAVAMHDYEVQLVMNRRRHPLVKPVMSLGERTSGGENSRWLNLHLENHGETMANKMYVELSFPEHLRGSLTQLPGEIDIRTVNGVRHHVFKYQMRDTGGFIALFPHASVRVLDGSRAYLELNFRAGDPMRYGDDRILCIVYADASPPQQVSATMRALLSGEVTREGEAPDTFRDAPRIPAPNQES